ncbi:cuticle protein 8-like [Anthonomus grandis grandis]|uniref:cuticle protein 8-like n=1 Tax=Anthonomus grandis grandis TaxID=2921223 RepID=UPI0021667518|nr:cuticle protein 8-like [Anthonomus grandis grandis]
MSFHVIFLVVVCQVAVGYGAIVNRDPYTFSYVIDAGSVVSQHTEEGSDNMVRGSYSFLQPDGKVRSVWYKVDEGNGFKAFIKYRDINHVTMKGPLRFPSDFRHPIVFEKPVSVITKSLLGEGGLGHKKHFKH